MTPQALLREVGSNPNRAGVKCAVYVKRPPANPPAAGPTFGPHRWSVVRSCSFVYTTGPT